MVNDGKCTVGLFLEIVNVDDFFLFSKILFRWINETHYYYKIVESPSFAVVKHIITSSIIGWNSNIQ